jgi:hypothetical protein
MKIARRLIPAALLATVLLSTHSSGHDIITTPITFSREISRVLYSRCAECHRPGGSAFSLLIYEEARPWAKAIEEEVLERRMPPWGAVKGFGEFRDDQGLTQEQLELIAEWVEGGAPGGDSKYLPKVPDFGSAPDHRPQKTIVCATDQVIEKAITVGGVRTDAVADGATFMATAKLPDGNIEPLLWMYNYQKRFDRAYWYKTALHLPAGTRIELTPRDVGSIALLISDRQSAP